MSTTHKVTWHLQSGRVLSAEFTTDMPIPEHIDKMMASPYILIPIQDKDSDLRYMAVHTSMIEVVEVTPVQAITKPVQESASVSVPTTKHDKSAWWKIW